jgi:hypothetical protein
MMTRALLLLVVASAPAFAQVVPWKAETSSIPSVQAGDPAVTSLAVDGGRAPVVVGTDTAQVGVYLWNADAGVLQVIGLGASRSADALGDFVVVSVAAGSLHFFGPLPDAGLFGEFLPTGHLMPSAGAVALTALDGGLQVWVERSGRVDTFDVVVSDGGLSLALLGSVMLAQPASGIAVDRRNGRLFASQPTRGIVAADRGGMAKFVASIDAGRLGGTVGGLVVLPLQDGGTWVLTANASTEQVAAHELVESPPELVFIGQVQLGQPDGGARRVRLPGFLAATTAPLVDFPRGLLAVHDGVSANYKLVSLEDFDPVLPLPPLATEEGGVPLDAGAAADAGADAGVSDGGQDAGLDGGRRDGGGGGGGTTGPGSGTSTDPMGCTCAHPALVFLPALLVLWWIRRPRSGTPRS